MTVELTQAQWEQIAEVIRSSTVPGLQDLMLAVEKANGLRYHALLVQWQDPNQKVPKSARFPEKWPPEFRMLVGRYDRPLTKQDVLTKLQEKCTRPLAILVTVDTNGMVGWTKLEDFFPE